MGATAVFTTLLGCIQATNSCSRAAGAVIVHVFLNALLQVWKGGSLATILSQLGHSHQLCSSEEHSSSVSIHVCLLCGRARKACSCKGRISTVSHLCVKSAGCTRYCRLFVVYLGAGIVQQGECSILLLDISGNCAMEPT